MTLVRSSVRSTVALALVVASSSRSADRTLGWSAVTVVIPSRLDSTRIPRKALAPLRGFPLVEHVRRRAVAAEVGPVVVATDNAEIASVVRSYGGECVLTGPAANGTHRVELAARQLPGEVFLNVQGDQPALDPDHVRRLAQLMEHALLGTVVTELPTPARDDPARVKARVEGGCAVDFSRSYRLGFDHLHVGLYGYTRESLRQVTAAPIHPRARAERLEQLTWLERGWPISVTEVGSCEPAIDTPEQLEILRGE